MEPLIATMITALAYTVPVSDNRRFIAINAPGVIVMLAVPSAYPDKFCTTIGNVSFIGAIKLRSAAPIGKATDLKIWPGQKVSLEMKSGRWSIPEGGCLPDYQPK